MNKLLFLLVFIIPSISSAEECDLSVSAPSPSATYSQNNLNERLIQTVVLTKLNNAACSGRIGFSVGNQGVYPRSLSYVNSTLYYSLYRDSASNIDLKDVVDAASSNEYISFSFQEGANLAQSVSFYYKLDDNQQQTFLKRSGSYSDLISLRFYPTDNLISYKTVSMSLSGTVSPVYSVRVGQTNSNYSAANTNHSLSFDKNNPNRTASAYVLANDSYTLSFSSLNNGKLVHTVTPTESISYSLSTGGYSVNLLAGDSIQFQNITPSIGFDHVLNFYCTIDPPNQLAGSYTDIVTVTVGPDL
jgi:hypothetical protein